MTAEDVGPAPDIGAFTKAVAKETIDATRAEGKPKGAADVGPVKASQSSGTIPVEAGGTRKVQYALEHLKPV